MVKDSAKVDGGSVPLPLLRCAEKGKTKLKSCDMKKKKIKKKKEDGVAPDVHLFELIDQRMLMGQILPEDAKILYATNVDHPRERLLAVADIEEFFRGVGKIVKVEIQHVPKTNWVVDFVKIEFESHDVAKKAMEMNGRYLFDNPVMLNAFPKPERYIKKDCTNERQMISCSGFGKAISANNLKSELEKYFSSVGEVEWVNVPLNRKGLSKGYAYIIFKDEKGFQKAFDLDGTLFLDSTLHVRRTKVFVTN